ncbi:MAG: sigma-70 family RNA polymerase sigma factor, partial [Deltaproteobacteria bacterium]|nr:sigma-70 family RNA polymerase sigma factor [Deltaproteobacteria bacterium]
MDLPPRRPQGYDFEAAYHAHFDYVWTTLVRLGVGRTDLEDGVQDVFVVAHRRRGDFDGSSAVRTWLFGIARRVASDYRRRDQRHRRRLDALVRHDRGPSELEDMARRTDGAWLLQQFLASLDEGKRAVFVLTELEQMTSAEVAHALGLNRNTVATRLRTARLSFERYAQRVRRPTSAQMLLAARHGVRPPPRVRARLLGLVLARVDLGAGSLATTAGLGVLGTVKAVGLTVAIAAGLLGVMRLGAGVWFRPTAEPVTRTEPPARSPPRPLASVSVPAAERSAAVPHAEPPVAAVGVPATRTEARGRAVESDARPVDDLHRQNEQLQATRTALRRGDAARALQLTADYERTFPQ